MSRLQKPLIRILTIIFSSLFLTSTLQANIDSPFNSHYFAVFEVNGNQLSERYIADKQTEILGIAGWNRITALFPLSVRENIIQYNVMGGRRWAGSFDGSGKNDMGRPGYKLSIAKYLLKKEKQLHESTRAASARRGTLDWTLIHEIGHYVCLTSNAIELFSQSFDGDTVPQPPRRKQPSDYPEDGSPRTEGNFVTSYAERNAGDEEVVETFTTYMTIKAIPSNTSLVARKIRFFDTLPGFPEMRQHIQNLSK